MVFPAYDINAREEHTGRHYDEQGCFRAVYEAVLAEARKDIQKAIGHLHGFHPGYEK